MELVVLNGSGERKITMAKKKRKKGHAKSVKAFDFEAEMNYELSLWDDMEQSRAREKNELIKEAKPEEKTEVLTDDVENVMNAETHKVARAATLTLRSLGLMALAAESKEKEFIPNKVATAGDSHSVAEEPSDETDLMPGCTSTYVTSHGVASTYATPNENSDETDLMQGFTSTYVTSNGAASTYATPNEGVHS